jgi:hypothetical protein
MNERLPIVIKDGVYLILFIICAYVAIDTVETKTSNDAMRKIVAKCLSDSVGRPITIGNEIYLCGIVSTGERI